MSTNAKLEESHVRSFRLDAAKVREILRSQKPLDQKQLLDLGSSETYSMNTFDRLGEPLRGKLIPVPESVGSLVFPMWFEAPQFICFCSSYTWQLLPDENGLLRLYLQCNYLCIRAFSIVESQ